MARVSGKSSKAKRHRVKAVSARKLRKVQMQSQMRYGRTGVIKAKKVMSMRGRFASPMEQAAPDMPQSPQDLFMLSTAIRKWKYYITKRTLRLTWIGGEVYDYYDVPESVVSELDRAQSKGRYVYYNIRTSYKYKRIR